MKNLDTKKLVFIAGGIIGTVFVIIIILLLYNALFGKPSYQKIENKILIAAKKYYKANDTLLPKSDKEEVTITDASLTSAGYLDSMAKLVKKMKGVTCTATVMVTYSDGEYRYAPLLDCGEHYRTSTIVDQIKNNVGRVTEGSGLYDLNGELVYRGEEPNNFVKFSGHLWRIVKIEGDQALLIFSDKGVNSIWDDRYNIDKQYTNGINDYRVSRAFDKLKEIYDTDSIVNKDLKSLLSAHTLYIGKRYDVDAYNDGSIEKTLLLEGQYMGLLPLYDYINASVDTNCNSSITKNCSNYNYLNHYDYNWWTITADASTTYKVFRVEDSGVTGPSMASLSAYLRPTIYLAKNAIYVSGEGTEGNPYTIK